MTISWNDLDQLLIEVIRGTPVSKSKVKRTDEVDAQRRRLVVEVDEMRAEGIAPQMVED